MSSGDEVQRGTCHERHKGMVNIFRPSRWLFRSPSELDMSAPYLATASKRQNQPCGRPLGKRRADGEQWRRKNPELFKTN